MSASDRTSRVIGLRDEDVPALPHAVFNLTPVSLGKLLAGPGCAPFSDRTVRSWADASRYPDGVCPHLRVPTPSSSRLLFSLEHARAWRAKRGWAEESTRGKKETGGGSRDSGGQIGNTGGTPVPLNPSPESRSPESRPSESRSSEPLVIASTADELVRSVAILTAQTQRLVREYLDKILKGQIAEVSTAGMEQLSRAVKQIGVESRQALEQAMNARLERGELVEREPAARTIRELAALVPQSMATVCARAGLRVADALLAEGHQVPREVVERVAAHAMRVEADAQMLVLADRCESAAREIDGTERVSVAGGGEATTAGAGSGFGPAEAAA